MKPRDILRASILSDYQTEVEHSVASRSHIPSRAPLHSVLRVARFPWKANASFAENDKVTLGSLGLAGARVIPEQCRIRGTGTGTPAVRFLLQKTNQAGGSAESLSALTGDVTSATAVTTLASPSGKDPVKLEASDLLHLVLDETTGNALTLAATNTFVVEVTYTAE